VSKFFMINL